MNGIEELKQSCAFVEANLQSKVFMLCSFLIEQKKPIPGWRRIRAVTGKGSPRAINQAVASFKEGLHNTDLVEVVHDPEQKELVSALISQIADLKEALDKANAEIESLKKRLHGDRIFYLKSIEEERQRNKL